ncbi:hypothetical protein GJV85_05920 [Sulfurimonas aquatica]|uniref:Uncharacterized protein n=1 Tax=Sulfurimonas aquatica TaxID=2672570 RepID=A0A975GCF4_9BACT|nr:hypothetical protein [Sulfurimonas aquatica]QSZ41661.1 hypothetical protein GJV85_05920 [Sulfurimonas aquatica]
MQIFGKFSTNFDMDYISEHYIYLNDGEDDIIDTKSLENMLKKKRKTVAGTIFLYNPELSPVGYKLSRFLQEEGFDQYDEFVTLNENPMSYVINAGLKNVYPGKLIEIRYLFSYNRADIAPTPIIEEFDADLDKLNSTQLTRYDKTLNYIDIPNIRLSGKFVFFGMGHKYDRHHKAIIAYTRALSAQVQKLDKQILFMHDNNYDADEALDMAYFLLPEATGKAKAKRANGFKEVFSVTPHKVMKII